MTPTHANVFLKDGCAILGATAHRWPNAYQMLSRQVIATYNLSSCINTALAEINLELIQLFALRWECRPTILAKCGDVGWVGAGKRRAKGCGSGLLQGGGADGFDAAGDLRRCWRLGFRMQRPLRRFAQVRCPISLIAWGGANPAERGCRETPSPAFFRFGKAAVRDGRGPVKGRGRQGVDIRFFACYFACRQNHRKVMTQSYRA